MKRSIKSTTQSARSWQVKDEDLADLNGWLLEQASDDRLWILAHAGDGVIWGKVDRAAKEIVTGAERFPNRGLAVLRPQTLQTCRLFGPSGEVMLWRGAGGWRARELKDGEAGGRSVSFFDEAQMVWGTQVEDAKADFTLVSDGVQGLLHAVPLASESIPFDPPGTLPALKRPLRLTLRHYLAQTDDGSVVISGSRLVALHAESKPNVTGESS